MAELKEPITIDIVSDVMCPWCYIGKKRLEVALESVSDIAVDIRWRPYQLDATLPASGKDRKKYLEDKFGGPDRAKEIYERINDAGRDDGIEFQFDKIEVSPNTLDAHRLIRWAQSAGDGVQNKLVDRLFRMYFMEGRHLGEHETLLEAASEAGMDADLTRDLLNSDSDVQAVQAEIGQASAMGVTGVPCFIINNQYAVMGAQDSQTLAASIREVASGRPETA